MASRALESRRDRTVMAGDNFDTNIAQVVWLLGFYGISTFEGYLKPNPFSCK